MKMNLFKALLISNIREKEVLFWIFAFPIILLTIMVMIFGSMDGQDINFKVALIDKGGEGMGTTIIRDVLKDVSTSSEGRKALFDIIVLDDTEEARQMLMDQKVSIIIEIPEDFNVKFNQVVFFSRITAISAQSPTVTVERVALRNASTLASDIFKQIMSSVNLEAAKRMNVKISGYEYSEETVGQSENFSYADFFLAGVLVMSFFSTGFFALGNDIAHNKHIGIMKRLSATPLSIRKFMYSNILSKMLIMVMSAVMLVIFGHFVFGSSFSILNPETFPFILLGILDALAFGLFIGSISKNANAASAIGNVLFFPMQFLGGLYFEVWDISPAVRWFVYINPMTYIAAGMRQGMGIVDAPVPAYSLYLVPLAWAAVMLVISIFTFDWRGDAS